MSPGKQIIVGGLGNLGKHMQRTLATHGLPTTIIDRKRPNFSNDSGDVVVHDLGVDDPMALRDCLRGADTVYSMVTPDVQYGTKRDFEMSNEIGLTNLVEACKSAGVPKLVHVSSIAVTNHFVSSVGQSERDPLPDLDTYVSAYDISKRRGEEIVLDANDGNNFKTCALRSGGLLAGTSDYTLRNMLSLPGQVVSTPGEKIDFMYAGDFCRALMKASEKLDDGKSDLAGQALFVTKCRDTEESPQAHNIAEVCADLIGRRLTTLPTSLFLAIQAGALAGHKVLDAVLTRDEESKYGIPPHLFMDMVNHEQTFDNSLARELLDFEPELTWKEALEHIFEDQREYQLA